MDLKDILAIIVIPISLAILAILWPEIQSRSRRRKVRRLIMRELSEISPYPKEATEEGWWQHCQKRFIHREIFQRFIDQSRLYPQPGPRHGLRCGPALVQPG